MRLVWRLVWVFALCVFSIGGCNEVITPTTAPLRLSIRGHTGGGEYQQPLEGAQVCEGDTDDNCDFSDANGEVTIEVPFDQEIFYTVEKEGYDSQLIPQVIPESGRTVVVQLSTVKVVADVYERAMSPYPRLGTGEVYIVVSPGDFAGVTFDLEGAWGTPFYQVGRGDPITYRLDLDATTSEGRGGFLEVPPGSTVKVVFGGTAATCFPNGSGWPGDDEHSVRIPVRAGYENRLLVSCTRSP